MEEMELERITKLVVTEFGFQLDLGDYALTGVVLGVS
jgi:hypothetical protein